ncbi:hypothetical protein X737_18050 [Mesorhizobium sp. L48C026A00]|nr:hypothetical protein X737_18050 [Mesorhizobium sp. L48C026A00]
MARIVPVLDLSRLEQGASERRTFLFDLRTAARDVGFFCLSGHGISAVEIDEVLDASRRFFALPEADKLAIEMVRSPQFRGYTRTGGELTKGKADWREQLDIGVERRPIPKGRDTTGGDQGVGAHKDGGFLTLLLQDDNKGLQVEYDGSWVNVDPIPGTLVVNIGELLELASNGYLRATVHRVVTPRPVPSEFPFHSSSAPGSMRRSRCSPCLKNWLPRRADRRAIRTTRCFATSEPTC